MSDKKHIDRLFQERFKDFEANPDPNVWNDIQSRLNANKKRRRVIPLWWKIAGVAALLILSFTIGNFIYNSNSNSDNPKEILVESENSTPKDLELDSNNSVNSTNKNNTVTSSADDLKSPEEIKTNSSNDSNDGNNQKHKSLIKNNSQLLSKSNLKKNNIASFNKENENKGQAVKKNLNPSSKSNKNTVTIIKNQQLENNNNSSNNIDEKANSDLIKNTISKTTAVVNQTENSKEKNKLNELKTLDEIEEPSKEEEGKLSIEEELADTKKEKEEIIEEEELKNRWNVMPNIAPVYFNTLGKGSSIDSQFANNDKSGTLNMSYGIAASYAINNRLAVRTGINKVNVGYDTNNVLIYQGVETSPNNSRPIKSINYNENAQNTVVISADNFAFAQVPGVLSNAIDASLDQRLGFIEVPLELSYKVSDKKLGINVIGGVSALFLNENEVYSTLNGNSRLLGEANNINETSFSANFGLGLDYKLSDKFDINLEPLFKYQMNTFKDTSGDFKPFIIGVYTGFSFKF